MDRNLGALDDRYHPASQNMSKYYQFGRKDPFNCDIYCWSYDADTFVPTKTGSANGMITMIKKSILDGSESGGYNTGGHNVPFSVNKPATLILANGNWSSTEDIFGGTRLADNTLKPWNDPSPSVRLENEEIFSLAYENKSFFDPCPPGWRIPVLDCWSGFRGDSSGSATGDSSMNCQWGVDSEFKNRGAGATYVPLGYLSQKGNPNAQTIFFPAFSYRYPYETGGGLRIYGRETGLWASVSTTSTNGDRFFPSSSSIQRGGIQRSTGFSVRCIKE